MMRPVLPLRRDHRMALFDGMHHGFLAVHILAGVHRVDGSLRVPVVRRSHDHGIDILARQQFVVIGRDEEVFAKYLPRARAPARVQIGDRHQRDARNAERYVHIRGAAPAQPDRANLDAIVGGDRGLLRSVGKGRTCDAPYELPTS